MKFNFYWPSVSDYLDAAVHDSLSQDEIAFFITNLSHFAITRASSKKLFAYD